MERKILELLRKRITSGKKFSTANGVEQSESLAKAGEHTERKARRDTHTRKSIARKTSESKTRCEHKKYQERKWVQTQD